MILDKFKNFTLDLIHKGLFPFQRNILSSGTVKKILQNNNGYVQPVLSHRRKAFGGGTSLYVNWDESTESGLDLTNGGASEAINLCMMENTSANANETSQGVAAGADLVFTDAGASIAGATGSPPSRALDAEDYFSFTTGLCNNFAANGGGNCTIITKISNVTLTDNNPSWINLEGVWATDHIAIAVLSANSFINVNVMDATVQTGNHTGDTAVDVGGGVVYFVAYNVTGSKFVIGFQNGTGGSGVNGQPTKKSDLTWSWDSAAAWGFANGDFTKNYIMTGHGAESMSGNLFYHLMSTDLLIDDAA